MPQRDAIVQTTEARILAIQSSIDNFGYARERLLRRQSKADSDELQQALHKNLQAGERMKQNLEYEVERLRKERARP